MTSHTQALTLYRITPAASSEFCSRCGARTYRVTAADGTPKLVDCLAEATRAPTTTKPGEGHEHALACATRPAYTRPFNRHAQ